DPSPLCSPLSLPDALPISQGACDLSLACLGRSRRADELRNKHHRRISPGRRVHRPDSQGREARRPTGHTVDQIRVRDQPQHRQGIRPQLSARAARHCRRGDRMTRREFITLLGGASGWPLAARAQQTAMPVIGFLSTSSQRVDDVLRLAPFRQGLKEVGYVEGLNVGSEYRGAEEHYERLPELAADLLRRQVAVIAVLGGPPVALVAKAASTTVPIVFTLTGADPVQLGLVPSFNRPGGNVTGVATVPGSVVSKQFEALHEAAPTAKVIGCLLNPNNPNEEAQTREAQEATRTLGRHLEVLYARDDLEIETVFAISMQKRVDALVVVADAIFN